MSDDRDLLDLQEEKNERAHAMKTTVAIALMAIFYVAGIAMWYGGHFSALGVASVPSNPAVAESSAAASPGTVGQAQQNTAPAGK